MRAVGFDVGAKRTGVAVSDASGTLARPLTALAGADVVGAAVALVERLAREDEGLAVVVVGLPLRSDGSDTHATPLARAFATALARRVATAVVLQDERLSSVEAEARLAVNERDWRRRKAKLDAAAAAVILQDYLDAEARRHAAAAVPGVPHDDEAQP
jgi:putative Holliday junction resolvase